VFALCCFGAAWAETVQYSIDGGMDIEITHPDSVISGTTFPVSILIQNNGWEDKQDVSFVFESNDVITQASGDGILVSKIIEGGSYGQTVNFEVAEGAAGTYFINIGYSHILLANNVEPQEPTKSSITLPITILESGSVVMHLVVPEFAFAGEEFPVTVEITPENADIRDVQLRIVTPTDIIMRGETLHLFSSIRSGETVAVDAVVLSPENVVADYAVPLQIILTYTDDTGSVITETKAASTTLRPRSFMEITSEGGIWVGDFFIAPYVSIGTIIGIPSGAILTLLIKRSQKPKKRKK